MNKSWKYFPIILTGGMIIITILIFLKPWKSSFFEKRAVKSDYASSTDQISQKELGEQTKKEIRKLLDRQVEALEKEDLIGFMKTMDETNTAVYNEMKEMLQFLFKNVNIIKAESEVQTIEKIVPDKVVAIVLNKLTVKYLDGAIETFEKRERVHYKELNGQWKESEVFPIEETTQ